MGLFRELRYELSALFFALGVLGVVLSFTQYLIPTQSPPWLQSIHQAVGQYVVWEALLGLLTVLGGGFYFVDTTSVCSYNQCSFPPACASWTRTRCSSIG